jgi:lipopolysaccharide/colanic/teichoic acid biosynthesis glycosyltransferase
VATTDLLRQLVGNRPIAGQAPAKRAMDVALALPAVLLLTPVFGMIGLVLVLEGRGPVFYSQERLGLRGRSFRIFKFRTMVVDAERDTGPIWAAPADSRVTRVGRFLRDTHLDELPQLINILRSEMSLVGPRPERPTIADRLEKALPGYCRRLSVPPGLTGLAQVRGGYDCSIESVRRKLRYDRLYIRRRSVLLDLSILVDTVRKIAGGDENGWSNGHAIPSKESPWAPVGKGAARVSRTRGFVPRRRLGEVMIQARRNGHAESQRSRPPTERSVSQQEALPT